MRFVADTMLLDREDGLPGPVDDVDGDRRLDIVVANKQGVVVFRQRRVPRGWRMTPCRTTAEPLSTRPRSSAA